MIDTKDMLDIDAESIVAQHGPFVMTTTGVIITQEPTYAEWSAATVWSQSVEKASPFWIGDLLQWGEAKFGEKYTQALAATGSAIGTLMNIASVAEKVPAERRHPDMTFTHHVEVAPLKPDEQTEWLDKAEVENWTSKELRHQIKVAKAVEKGQTLELGVWAACSDVDDQQKLFDMITASGHAAKKTSKEIA
jgi:Asp-tRNA(Asn)/Glu-tRNA(Gln) amidotransferase C subunit